MRAPSSATLTGGLMHRRVERRLCNSRRPFNLAQRQLGLRLLLQVEAFESRQRLLRVRAIVVPLGAVELTHVRGAPLPPPTSLFVPLLAQSLNAAFEASYALLKAKATGKRQRCGEPPQDVESLRIALRHAESPTGVPLDLHGALVRPRDPLA